MTAMIGAEPRPAAAARITCPVGSCREENATDGAACVRCGVPLQAYARVASYPALLFNRGLAAARAGRIGAARDCFAAIVEWFPNDIMARNALAMAAFGLGDAAEARRHWETVLARSERDEVAIRGLAALAEPAGTAVAEFRTKRAPHRRRKRHR